MRRYSTVKHDAAKRRVTQTNKPRRLATLDELPDWAREQVKARPVEQVKQVDNNIPDWAADQIRARSDQSESSDHSELIGLTYKDYLVSVGATLTRLPSSAKSKTGKRKYEPIDDEFIAKRSPGSKTVSYKRAKTQPLPTFYDKLNRYYLVERDEGVFKRDGIEMHVIQYKVRKDDPDARDVNIHLKPMEDEPEYIYFMHFHLLSKPEDDRYLIDTPLGRVCPKCLTNEFIRSDFKDTPLSFQDKNWRKASLWGEHCSQCKRVSKPRSA